MAHLFAQEGCSAFLLDVSAERGQSVAESIRKHGDYAEARAGDVRDPDSIAKIVDEAVSRFGRLDILVNNAGIYPRRAFVDMTSREWDEVHLVNLKGTFHCTRLVLPHMIRQQSGKIVNISSVTFLVGMKNLAHYIASKGGVVGITRALARELGEHNIHVNCITPGAVETETEKHVATTEQIEAIVAMQSLRRRIVPLDIARACLFLASSLSDGMTGQTINVDGGWAMH